MLKTLLTIGSAAESDWIHATRLAIVGNDSQGGGSATDVDEELETDEERALREQAEADAGLDEDEDTRSRRTTRQDKAYDDLKSDRDRLRNDLEKQQRETQEMRERVAKIEGETSTRAETNARANTAMERAQERARKTADSIAKIDPNDPDRTVKIYTEVYRPFYEELPQEAEAISKRTARETFQQERRLDKDQTEAKRVTLEALDKAGLDPEDYELVEALAIAKGATDPDWFKRVKDEDQIPTLVGMVKERIVKTTRQSSDFQDEKRAHRKPMDGVIERGTQTRRRVRDDEDDAGSKPGPGSILADMARAKAAKTQNTKIMLRQADSSR